MLNKNEKTLYSNPGSGEAFGLVHGLHSFAGQSFVAADSCLVQASIWLYEANNDSIKMDVLSKDIYSGTILATELLPPSNAGIRRVVFSDPIYLEKGSVYYIRVSSGAPGTNKGIVEKGIKNDGGTGYINTSKTNKNMALELVFKAWEGEIPVKSDAMEPEPGYGERLNSVLEQKRDVWGEALMALPEGPTYENIKDYLKPLMLCGTFLTDSGIYYIPMGRPESLAGGGRVALHAADGSQIISEYYNRERITLYVGKEGRERYGLSLKRLTGPSLLDRYLPVLVTSYEDAGGVRYMQESFSDYLKETDALVSFIKLTAKNSDSVKTSIKIQFTMSDDNVVLHEKDTNRLEKDQKAYLLFSGTAKYTSPRLTYDIILDPSNEKTIYIVKLLKPSDCLHFVPDENIHENAKKGMISYWNKRLDSNACFDVPEERVMKAMKNLLIQNLYMGWRYSVGNAYETFYSPESSDMAATLGMYGYLAEQKAVLCELIPMMKPNQAYANWELGEKLSHAAQYYFMTRDTSLVEKNIQKYEQMIENIKEQIDQSDIGLLSKQHFSGDISDPSYYFHHQAVVWKGLNDMAFVFDSMGEKKLNTICLEYASKLKDALTKAVEKSEVELEDGTLFIPSELLGNQTKVFDPITETRHGSYWNLCICYAFETGIFDYDSDRMKKAYAYLKEHGAWLLGMVRFNYYPVGIGKFVADGLAGYKTPGVDNVYGLPHVKLMSEMDDPDRLVLALYAKLAHGMTRETYISGEGDTVGVCPGEYYRSVYLPPSGANNSLFLKILRLILVRETTDREGKPYGLHLAYGVPRD